MSVFEIISHSLGYMCIIELFYFTIIKNITKTNINNEVSDLAKELEYDAQKNVETILNQTVLLLISQLKH